MKLSTTHDIKDGINFLSIITESLRKKMVAAIVYEFHWQAETKRYKLERIIEPKTREEATEYYSTPNASVPNEDGNGMHTPLMIFVIYPETVFNMPSGNVLTFNDRLPLGSMYM